MKLEGLNYDYVECKNHMEYKITVLTYSGIRGYYKSIEEVDFIKQSGWLG